MGGKRTSVWVLCPLTGMLVFENRLFREAGFMNEDPCIAWESLRSSHSQAWRALFVLNGAFLGGGIRHGTGESFRAIDIAGQSLFTVSPCLH